MSESLREAPHPCQRCGSEEWTDVDYSGCSDCRGPAEGAELRELFDYVPTLNPDGTVLG